MKSYYDIFPEAALPVVTLDVPRKTGGIPKGNYGFYECYCTEPSCDCRQVTVLVLNEKKKRKALIRYGFDAKLACAGPYLDPTSYQAPYAPALLNFFVNTINDRPDWLARMYRQYSEVRERVDGKGYRGEPFPEPGVTRCRAMPAPELEDILAQSLERANGEATAGAGESKGTGNAQDMPCFVELYAGIGGRARVGVLLSLQEEVRRHLAAHPFAGEELAALLPGLVRQSPEQGERIEAALTLLADVVDYLQVEVEGGRAGAGGKMESFQRALYRHIFLESEDLDLRMAVSDLLVRRRVDVIPELARARAGMLAAGSVRSDLRQVGGEEVLAAVAAHFESLRLASPFDAAQEMFQLFAINDPELQPALTGEMLTSEESFLREVAALMIFHHDPRVSVEASRMLAIVAGDKIAPDTLRRLIVCRNWFAEETRGNLDRAIANARRARVECGRLRPPAGVQVHASAVDGTGAQEFKILVQQASAFFACSILLRQGAGVVDAFVFPLKSRREADAFLAEVAAERRYQETSPEHLDLAVCHALFDGTARGVAPNLWLGRIAELLGRDRWRAIREG